MKDRLAESLLFSRLNDAELETVIKAGKVLTAESGTLLFIEGDEANRFFVVLSGKIKIFKTGADGKEQILMIASAGDSFAEAAVFSGRTYPASAAVIESSELFALTKSETEKILADNPTLAMNLIARLSELLRMMARLIEELSLEDVTTRLARYLQSLAEKFAPDKKNPSFELPEKKVVLAAMLGTIPETFSRALARLGKAGIISVSGQRVTVLNRQALNDSAAGQKL